MSDLLDCTGTWQLVGYAVFLLPVRLSVSLLQSLSLCSVLPHSSLPADDAGWLAGRLAWSHCGYVAVVAPGAPTDRNVLMYGQCGPPALMTNCTQQPASLFTWLCCCRVRYMLSLVRFGTKLCLRRCVVISAHPKCCTISVIYSSSVYPSNYRQNRKWSQTQLQSNHFCLSMPSVVGIDEVTVWSTLASLDVPELSGTDAH